MRLLLLFLAALRSLTAAVVQVPIRHTVVAPVDMGQHEGSIAEYYIVDATIGTPAQKLNLTLVLDLYYPYVFDSHLKQDCTASSGRRRYFEKGSSSTYKKHNVDFDMLIGAPKFLNYCMDAVMMSAGDVGQDEVTIGGASASTNFALVTRVRTASLQPFWSSDGVLGLLRVSPNMNNPYPTSSTVMDLAKAAGDGSVSLYLGNDIGFGKPGALTLGGRDTVNCEGNWTKFPQAVYDPYHRAPEFYWHLRVDGLRIGSYSNSTPMLAEVVPSTRTGVPPNIFRSLLKITGAEYDFASDEYIVACSAVKKLPDLVFTLDGDFELRIPATEYAKNLTPRKDRKCTVLFYDTHARVSQFGWRILQPYCWQFDYVNDVLAIAKTKH